MQVKYLPIILRNNVSDVHKVANQSATPASQGNSPLDLRAASESSMCAVYHSIFVCNINQPSV
jgi:hypothetical protein